MFKRNPGSTGPLLVLLVVGAAAFTAIVGPKLVGADTMFAQTGNRVWGPFEQYWKANGGLAQFGLPLTGVFPHGDTAAQWFERAAFTYNPRNPDPYKVQVQNLGWMAAAARCTERPFQHAASAGTGQYFASTGHNVSGKFLTFWKTKGALQTFGYPVSEAFTDRNISNGKDYLVQYFERAKMELHPEAAGTAYEVQLGLLGAERLAHEGGAQAFAHVVAPPFYPSTASAPSSARAGIYPKSGYAPDYSWVAGTIQDVSLPAGRGGPAPMRPSFPPSLHSGPGPIFAPPPPESMPTTYPNGVTVGRATRGDTSPPLSSITPIPPIPACSAMAADTFIPTGPVWDREKSRLTDGDYIVLIGHIAGPNDGALLGDRGRPYMVDRVIIIINH